MDSRGEITKITIPTQGDSLFVREEKIQVEKGERVQFFFYKDSVKKPPIPVRVVTFPEEIPTLPKLPKPVKK